MSSAEAMHHLGFVLKATFFIENIYRSVFSRFPMFSVLPAPNLKTRISSVRGRGCEEKCFVINVLDKFFAYNEQMGCGLISISGDPL